MTNGSRYPIRAVAKLTGLTVDTLRAWERRYQAVAPQRDDRGRLYSEADVERLRLLRAAVEGGHAIGRLAALSNDQLNQLLAVPALAAAKAPAATRQTPRGVDLRPILAGVERFDYAEAERELARLATLLSPRELIHQVAVPLMRRVGDEWYAGRLSVAQEHMVSALVRHLLGALVRLYARADPPGALLFATPSGEQHEFGILSAAMLASGGGLGVVYLGANLPGEEIVEAGRRAGVQAVVLGLVGAAGAKASLAGLRHVAEQLPPGIEIWVGGAKAEEVVREVKQTRAIFLEDFDSLERHLTRLGARF